ncbi:hypothetical protein BHE74_00018016 [Ensete ventricosum]|nr:hypothetical protein BHE74_00018016 [Ensete ventricosum]
MYEGYQVPYHRPGTGKVGNPYLQAHASPPVRRQGVRRGNMAKKKKEEYGKLQKAEMSIWDCIELLNGIVDESDPDLDEPQIEHLLQSAEAVRRDYPDQDWLHLTALIHGILSKSIISFDVDILCSFMTQGIRSHWAVHLTNP